MKMQNAPNLRVLKFMGLGFVSGLFYLALAAGVYFFPWPAKLGDLTGFSLAWLVLLGLAIVFAVGTMSVQFRDRRARPLVKITGYFILVVSGFHLVYFGYYLVKVASFYPLMVSNQINRQLLKAMTDFFGAYQWSLWGVGGLVVIVLIMEKYADWRFTLDSEQGSGKLAGAHLAAADELDVAGLYGPEGSILGRAVESRKILRSPAFSERIIIAPSGAGKDTGVLIPVLLSENRPFILFDPKFEYSSVTKRYREGLSKGRRVIVLDPFRVGLDPAYQAAGYKFEEQGFNPLSFVREPLRERTEDINNLAKALVVRPPEKNGGSDTSNHFFDLAEMFMRCGLHFYMGEFFKQRLEDPAAICPTLLDVFHLIGLPNELFREQMLLIASEYAAELGPTINTILGIGNDEFGSFKSTTLRQLEWVNDANMRDFIQHTSFTLEEVFANRADIFVVVKEDQIENHKRFVRLVFQVGIKSLQQLSPTQKPPRTVCFLVNEAGALGYMQPVEDAWNILRARGGVFWLVFQNRAQMKVYPLAGAFEAAKVKHIFGTRDDETIKWVGSLGGEKTVMTESFTTGQGMSNSGRGHIGNASSSGQRSVSVSEQRTKLFKPEDLYAMPEGQQIVFYGNLAPVVCERLRYFDEEMFKGLFDQNPMEQFKST